MKRDYQRIEIWQPKHSTREVLIAVDKAAKRWGLPDIFQVTFTKVAESNEHYGKKYMIPGTTIRQYPIGTNGKIRVYLVPLQVVEQHEVET